MKTIDVKIGNTVSRVLVGADPGMDVPSHSGEAIIITDTNVKRHYPHLFPEGSTLVIEPGEDSKSLSVAENIIRQMSALGVDRSSFILGIGGGVVCDLAGFVASVYMRGIPFGFISTSLLSQVDASIGGKNGVNVGDIKNLAGLFALPRFVVCNTSMLATLPDVEFQSGIGELIKYSIIGDPELFSLLNDRSQELKSRDPEFLSSVVAASIEVKRAVVEADFRESGIRKSLNLGHTLGHAIELTGKINHGSAVAIGMAFAADWSREKGLLSISDHAAVTGLLERYEFIPHRVNIDGNTLPHIEHDKKKRGDRLDFIFIKEIGKVVVESVPITEIKDYALKWGRKR